MLPIFSPRYAIDAADAAAIRPAAFMPLPDITPCHYAADATMPFRLRRYASRADDAVCLPLLFAMIVCSPCLRAPLIRHADR